MSSNLVKRRVAVNPLYTEDNGFTESRNDQSAENAERLRVITYESLCGPDCRRAAISVKVTDSPCPNDDCLSIPVYSEPDDGGSLEYSSLSSSNTPQKDPPPRNYLLCGIQFCKLDFSRQTPMARRKLRTIDMLSRILSWVGYNTSNYGDAATCLEGCTHGDLHHSVRSASSATGSSQQRTHQTAESPLSGNVEMVDILLDSSVQSRNHSQHHSQYIDFEDSASLHMWDSTDSSDVDDDTVFLSQQRAKYPRVFFCF